MTALAAIDPIVGGEGWAAADGGIAAAAWSPTLEAGYQELAPAVLGYFRSHRVDQPEDLVGEVFVSVARNLHRFRGNRDDFRRWVFAIAHRRRVDDVRRWRTRRRVVAAQHVDRSDRVDASTYDKPVALDVDLLAALAELTPRQREVVVLRFVADLPLHDVARIVGRPTGAVKALQARALARLAKRLDVTDEQS